MKIRKSRLKTYAVIFGLFAIITGVFIIGTSLSTPSKVAYSSVMGNYQTIELKAKGGYTPNKVIAKADLDTRLAVITENSFDCSSTMNIPQLNISRILPVTGKTEVDLGKQIAGTQLDITCAAGLYSAQINFQ